MTINRLSEYGHSFQIKVLASLLTDNKFLSNIVDIINVEHFESESHKWLIQFIIDYFNKYRIHPTMDVLAVEVKKLKKDSLKVSIITELEKAYCSTPDDIEYVQEEFFSFCKNQKIKAALLQSVELLNDGMYGDITRIMNDALKHDHEKDLGHDYNNDFEQRYDDTDEQKVITFPWKILNTITDGGLEPGNLVLIFAPPGTGKTTVVANIAAHCLKMGWDTLFYTLEIKEKKIGQKIDSIISGIPKKDLKKNKNRVKAAIDALPGKLRIKGYSPRKATLDTLRAHRRNLKTNEGFNPKVVFIDYPELLKVVHNRREKTEEIEDVYTEIKGDAMEENIPYICPSQINRAGSKDTIIEGDKVAGSYSKMMLGDLNISLSRLRKDKLNNTGRFHIVKSRLGPDGMTYSAIIDLDRDFIDISEEEFDEEEPAATVNGHDFDSEDMNELRSKFKKFEKKISEDNEEENKDAT